jgi:hypothetical protein
MSIDAEHKAYEREQMRAVVRAAREQVAKSVETIERAGYVTAHEGERIRAREDLSLAQ